MSSIAEKFFEEIYVKITDKDDFGISDIVEYSDKINEISNDCKTTDLFKHGESEYERMIKDIYRICKDDIEQNKEVYIIYAWNHLDDRLASGPTIMHKKGAAIMCIPILDHFLQEYKQEDSPVESEEQS